MRFPCNSLNRSGNNIAVWIAIYISILFNVSNHPRSHHNSVAVSITAFAVILLSGLVAWFYCRRHIAA